MLSVIDDPTLRDRIAKALAGEEARVLQERAATLEAAMLAIPFTFIRYSHGGDARFIKKGQESAARWNQPFVRAILVNFIRLFELPFKRSFAGVRDHSIELYGEILYRIAIARGGWK